MNLNTKLTAPEVKQIIEKHLNERLLGNGQAASITQLTAGSAPSTDIGVPNLELYVTFTTVVAAKT